MTETLTAAPAAEAGYEPGTLDVLSAQEVVENGGMTGGKAQERLQRRLTQGAVGMPLCWANRVGAPVPAGGPTPTVLATR